MEHRGGRAGKPVLAEKPYARNADEAREVAAAAQAAGVPVVEAFHYRYHPVTCRLLELIARGDLGELRHVEVDMGMPAPGDDDPRWQLELAGGALMDLGCYGLHVLRTVGKIVGAGAARSSPRVRSSAIPASTPAATSTCGSVTSPRAAPTAWSTTTITSPSRCRGPAEKRWCTTSSSRRRTTG